MVVLSSSTPLKKLRQYWLHRQVVQVYAQCILFTPWLPSCHKSCRPNGRKVRRSWQALSGLPSRHRSVREAWSLSSRKAIRNRAWMINPFHGGKVRPWRVLVDDERVLVGLV